MLHIVNKSPEGSTALADCLRFCRSGDAVMLIEDGVYAALAGEWLEQLLATGAQVHALTPDLAARGVAERCDGRVAVLDYAGFVQLCCDHNPIQSWY
jgi:tRNA 2-thiouridine synthesizing protein B